MSRLRWPLRIPVTDSGAGSIARPGGGCAAPVGIMMGFEAALGVLCWLEERIDAIVDSVGAARV